MKKTISIAVCDPGPTGVGGFEWRYEPTAAEKEWRGFRTTEGTATLWHGVEVPEDWSGEKITDWVDLTYWEGDDQTRREIWGEPAKVFRRGV